MVEDSMKKINSNDDELGYFVKDIAKSFDGIKYEKPHMEIIEDGIEKNKTSKKKTCPFKDAVCNYDDCMAWKCDTCCLIPSLFGSLSKRVSE